MKSLSHASDILVNMLKKEKKKVQDALHGSGMDRNESRRTQSSPLPAGNPEGPRTLPPSAPTQAQDSTTFGHRSSLLHRKTGQWYLFINIDYRTLHRIS